MTGSLLIEWFKSLFGSYTPIQNIVSEVDGVVTYSYSIDFAAVTHFILVIILFWCVCKTISCIILNMAKGVSPY